MSEIKTFKEFEEKMRTAFSHSNFFDSRHLVDDLKKHYSEKEIKAFLNKNILLRKKNEKLLSAEIEKLRHKYSPRNDYMWKEALDYVSHRYQKGDSIVFYYDGIQSGVIDQLTKRGYKVFIGRKIGIAPEIKFANVIGHVSDTKRLIEELEKNKVQK